MWPSFRFLVFSVGVSKIALVLIYLGMSSINWLQQILHLLVLLSIDCIIKLINEEVIILLLPLFLLLLECLEVFLSFLHTLF